MRCSTSARSSCPSTSPPSVCTPSSTGPPAPRRGPHRHRHLRVGGDHRAIGGAPLGVRRVGGRVGRGDRRHHRPARSVGAGRLRRRRPLAYRVDTFAVGWAALAGVAPVLTFVDDLTFEGAGTFQRLGLAGEQPRLGAVLTGITTAVVFAIVGRRRHDAGLVLIGVALGAVGAVASWTGQRARRQDTLIGLASLFLVVRAGRLCHPRRRVLEHPVVPRRPRRRVVRRPRHARRGHPDLSRTVHRRHQHRDGRRHTGARRRLARRRPPPWPTRSVLAALAAATCGRLRRRVRHRQRRRPRRHPGDPRRRWPCSAATEPARRSPCSPPPGRRSWRSSRPRSLVAVGIAGSLVLAEAAVRRSTRRPPTSGPPTSPSSGRGCSRPLALVPGAIAVAAFIERDRRQPSPGWSAGRSLATAVAVVLDRGRVTGGLPLGTLARVGSVAVLVGAAELPAAEVAIVALAVAGLSVADAFRLRARRSLSVPRSPCPSPSAPSPARPSSPCPRRASR